MNEYAAKKGEGNYVDLCMLIRAVSMPNNRPRKRAAAARCNVHSTLLADALICTKIMRVTFKLHCFGANEILGPRL